MAKHNITVTVNGEAHTREVDSRLLLVHLIRDDLTLTGTHIGCDTTHCGACTVLLNGAPTKSCTVLAVQADGAEIGTVEGLAGADGMTALQEGFQQEHGLQCGFCTPGMLMTGTALLESNPDPSEAEIREAISGNLCRCTGYVNIVKAVQYRRRQDGGGQLMAPRTSAKICGMGHSMKRKEDPRFLQGKGNFIDDHTLPGMLWLDIVRSPIAYGKIKNIDSSKALEIDGVLAVLTGYDLEGYGLHWMPTLMSDTQMVLPTDTVMYQAQEVAGVIATSRYAAADGVAAVEVEYEPMKPVMDPFRALEDDAPVLRTDKEGKTDNRIWHWEAGDKEATDKILQRGRRGGAREDARAAHPRGVDRDVRLSGRLQPGRGAPHRVHDHAGAARDPHCAGSGGGACGAFRGEDPRDFARHRGRVRWQGAGVPRLRDRDRGVGGAGQAGQVDRGPDGEPAGGLVRA